MKPFLSFRDAILYIALHSDGPTTCKIEGDDLIECTPDAAISEVVRTAFGSYAFQKEAVA